MLWLCPRLLSELRRRQCPARVLLPRPECARQILTRVQDALPHLPALALELTGLLGEPQPLDGLFLPTHHHPGALAPLQNRGQRGTQVLRRPAVDPT